MHTPPAPADCPFCRANGLLKGDVLAESDAGYMIEAIDTPGHYLIIPEVHAERAGELPDTWWREVKRLLAQVPDMPGSYNLSHNIGRYAGQTVGHLHLWVIPRRSDSVIAGKGVAQLIAEADS